MNDMKNGDAANHDAAQTKSVAPINMGERGVQLQTIEDMYRFANAVTRSGFAPKGMEKPESILIAVEMGLEVGLRPMQAIQNIAVINGRPCLWGDAALGLVKSSGVCQHFAEWFEGEGDSLVAVCETQRAGYPTATRQTFSISDAKRAGLWAKAGPWQQYPMRMLQMRARAFALRDAYPDVLRGLNVAEEARDIPAPIDVTDSVAAAAPPRTRDELKARLAPPPEPLQDAPQDAPPADDGAHADLFEPDEFAAAAAEKVAIAERLVESVGNDALLEVMRDFGYESVEEMTLEQMRDMAGRIEAVSKPRNKKGDK